MTARSISLTLLAALLLAGCGGGATASTMTAPVTSTTDATSTPAATTTLPAATTTEGITTTTRATTTTIEVVTTTTVAPFPPGHTAGEELIRENDGVTMVWVPGGTFTMGSDDSDPWAHPSEFPAHEVILSGFWIDRTEVTNAAYLQCVAAGGCREGRYSNNPSYNGADYPVVGVSWDDAAAYCTWAGAALPTEAEWEHAARGPDVLIYPWGDAIDPARANLCDVNCEESWAGPTSNDGYAETAPVGAYPNGAGWSGTLDQAGNVWEWVHDWYADYTGAPLTDPFGPDDGRFKVIRGGCFANAPDGVRGAYRLENGGSISPGTRHPNIGFRCAA